MAICKLFIYSRIKLVAKRKFKVTLTKSNRFAHCFVKMKKKTIEISDWHRSCSILPTRFRSLVTLDFMLTMMHVVLAKHRIKQLELKGK